MIDRTNCKRISDKGSDKEIRTLGNGKLTRTATKIAEEKKLGLLKTRHGYFRVIRECGLGGVCDEYFETLEAVDEYLKKL